MHVSKVRYVPLDYMFLPLIANDKTNFIWKKVVSKQTGWVKTVTTDLQNNGLSPSTYGELLTHMIAVMTHP